ncbi:MAG: glycosyltransferase family 4 protein [Bacteriovorax sp.]|nr:glycosyltransferase family 4 protein [Bacteriovorax sp.]
MITGGILVFFHCSSNTGYAIGRLETVFFDMALNLTKDVKKIHFGYPDFNGGASSFLPSDFNNIIKFNSADSDPKSLKTIQSYIMDNKIEVVLGFDQPVSRPAYSVMRRAGIKLFVSYWGAPMSSINHGIKLLFKKIEVRLKKTRPDHFIFESNAMAETAVFGRGIVQRDVTVIPLGVDTEIFKANPLMEKYAYEIFSIPKNRKIIFYSGHMEERKGVHVIVKAANTLILERRRIDVHFLILGNLDGQEKKFAPMYAGTETEKYITFGGYRDDINWILSSPYVGVIASTGWDSFTMSALEMASSGLPLIVSNLQGLVEVIEIGKTGYLIEPGNHVDLANRIEQLIDNIDLRNEMSVAARKRIIEGFSREKQIENLTNTVQRLYDRLC